MTTNIAALPKLIVLRELPPTSSLPANSAFPVFNEPTGTIWAKHWN